MTTLVFTVTTDISFDQRMQRICHSLALAGYKVILIGRLLPNSLPLPPFSFDTIRIPCKYQTGKRFYAEYNWKLYHQLKKIEADIFCAIDLDTVLPVYYAAKSNRNSKIVYDAHEWFSEMKEVVRRPIIQLIWKKIEAFAFHRFPNGYTVGPELANRFARFYAVQYPVIRNVPYLEAYQPPLPQQKPVILYQGAINEGRGLEELIAAMQWVEGNLHLVGNGNVADLCEMWAVKYGVKDKVLLQSAVSPAELKQLTAAAGIGINLIEPVGGNQIYSLANKFFDYMHAGLPQITMNFPEYARILETYPVGITVNSLDPKEIAHQINLLLNSDVLYSSCQLACLEARKEYNWQKEEQVLLNFYASILPS